MSLAGDFRFFFFGVHQAEFLHFVAEGIAADVQEPGGAGLVAIDCRSELHEMLDFFSESAFREGQGRDWFCGVRGLREFYFSDYRLDQDLTHLTFICGVHSASRRQ